MPKLQLMQVGVNEYDPASEVSALQGCIKDLDTLFDYLKTDFEHLFNPNDPQNKPLRFTDADATREKVIAGFLELAKRTQPDDFVLIQFSGHGSQSVSAKELWDHSSTPKYDEGFLLHDSRLPNSYDLADKEIAQLLSAFPAGAEIVFIADCCHAGTITREGEGTNVRARYHEARKGEPRPFNSYYGYDSKDSIPKIPESDHISITACSGKEKAFEDEQGIFTQALIEQLRAAKGQVSYAKLFERVRTKVNQVETAQTPQFDIQGNFNSQRFFLSKAEDEADSYQVIRDYETKEWRMMAGAVHGLSDEMQLRLAIRPADRPEAIAKTATVKSVRMAHCVLEGFDADDFELPRRAKITNVLSPSLKFDLVGNDALCKAFKDQFEPLSPFYTVGFFVDAKYKLTFSPPIPNGESVRYEADLSLNEPQKLIHKVVIDNDNEEFFSEINSALQLVERWERFRAVNSFNSDLNGKFDWYIEVDGAAHRQAEFSLDLTMDQQQKIIPKAFKIMAHNQDKYPMHFCLLQFNRNYSILPFKPNIEEVNPDGIVAVRESTFTILGNAPASKLIFKLIVSRRPLDLSPFEQKMHLNLGDVNARKTKNTRDTEEYEEVLPDQEAWQTDHKIVNLIRKP